MQDISGKVAFVTGAGFGIGLAIARALAERGAHVMLNDIDPERLENARVALQGLPGSVAAIAGDVAKIGDVEAAAVAVIEQFGKVHLLFNNAGVSLAGQPGDVALTDWNWVVDVNLMGVVHGVETFVPLMQAHGEGGYIVNTASMAGHLAAPQLGPYNATKFAVVGLSETMAQDLAPAGIGVSVLCPGWVRTDIHNAHQRRPSNAGQVDPDEVPHAAVAAVLSGIDPKVVAEWTLDCIAAGRLYIFTHPEMADFITNRFSRIRADYDACAADPRFKAS